MYDSTRLADLTVNNFPLYPKFSSVPRIGRYWRYKILLKESGAVQNGRHPAFDAGVPLLTGSDCGLFGVIPGASIVHEIELIVASGLSLYEALNSATRVNAEIFGFENTGMILPGYRANLVLLPNDPLTDIGAVEFPAGVMIGNTGWMSRPLKP